MSEHLNTTLANHVAHKDRHQDGLHQLDRVLASTPQNCFTNITLPTKHLTQTHHVSCQDVQDIHWIHVYKTCHDGHEHFLRNKAVSMSLYTYTTYRDDQCLNIALAMHLIHQYIIGATKKLFINMYNVHVPSNSYIWPSPFCIAQVAKASTIVRLHT